jgi:hypothetical protein
MNTADSRLYLYSEEAAVVGLPATVRVERYLAVGESAKKAAVVSLEAPAYSRQLTTVVVLAKGTSAISEAFDGSEVGVYVMPLDARAGDERLDLTGGLQPVLDWGALTKDLERAKQMQVKPHAA